jgi:hypothetical protein
MDNDALLRPRGPLPAAVYWRRRLVTFGVVVVLLALVVRSCGGDTRPAALRQSPSPTGSPPSSAAATGPSGPSGPTGSARPTGSPSATASARPSASATPTGPPKPCVAADLVLTAKADAQTYPAGRRPVLTIGIANKGRAPCTRDVGQPAREIRVASGNDRVWSSDDCSTGGAAMVVTLQPGAAAMTFSVTWSRKRSAAGCAAGQRDAAPGTYRLTGRFGDLTSAGDTFTLG